jgi:hypothetical protein
VYIVVKHANDGPVLGAPDLGKVLKLAFTGGTDGPAIELRLRVGKVDGQKSLSFTPALNTKIAKYYALLTRFLSDATFWVRTRREMLHLLKSV